jgi:hypothetical protein
MAAATQATPLLARAPSRPAQKQIVNRLREFFMTSPIS